MSFCEATICSFLGKPDRGPLRSIIIAVLGCDVVLSYSLSNKLNVLIGVKTITLSQ